MSTMNISERNPFTVNVKKSDLLKAVISVKYLHMIGYVKSAAVFQVKTCHLWCMPAIYHFYFYNLPTEK